MKGTLKAVLDLVARTLLAWVGTLTVVNVIGAVRHPGFDENLWWVDLRVLPGWLEHAVLAASGALLLAWAIRPARTGRRHWISLAAMAVLCLAAAANSLSYWRAWSQDAIDPLMPIPLSLLILGALVLLAIQMARPAPEPSLHPLARLSAVIATSLVFVIAIPLAQMAFFGTTDYRRPADAAVVFGAKVNPPGVPSQSLAQRMDTAIALYDAGLVDAIIVSGGREPTGYDEAEVMRDYAVDHGVPAAAIMLDAEGVNTDATVANTAAIADERGIGRLLAVSHFYHLARIKLAYQRAGIDVATVPSAATMIPQLPGIVAREIPAFWSYYLRAVAS